MFDIGFFELLVVGIVALIVVGPKDLPMMFRTIGRFTGKARSMAREFTSAMNQAADESGMRDIQRDLNTIANPKKAGLDALKDAADAFDDWDPMKAAEEAASKAKGPAAPSPAAPTPAEPTPAEAQTNQGSTNQASTTQASTTEGPATQALRADREELTAAIKAEASARAKARADKTPDMDA